MHPCHKPLGRGSFGTSCACSVRGHAHGSERDSRTPRSGAQLPPHPCAGSRRPALGNNGAFGSAASHRNRLPCVPARRIPHHPPRGPRPATRAPRARCISRRPRLSGIRGLHSRNGASTNAPCTTVLTLRATRVCTTRRCCKPRCASCKGTTMATRTGEGHHNRRCCGSTFFRAETSRAVASRRAMHLPS